MWRQIKVKCLAIRTTAFKKNKNSTGFTSYRNLDVHVQCKFGSDLLQCVLHKKIII